MLRRFFFPFFSDSMNMEVASLKKMKNNDVLLTLPGTLKVRDIGWLSIWCKRFTVNYGEVYIPSDLEIPEKVVSTVIMSISHCYFTILNDYFRYINY